MDENQVLVPQTTTQPVCPDCQFGLIAGRVCESCQGTGVFHAGASEFPEGTIVLKEGKEFVVINGQLIEK